jgi:hypothetical protein
VTGGEIPPVEVLAVVDNNLIARSARHHHRLSSTCSRPVASIGVATQHTFMGVRLSVPTPFGAVATSWPLARLSIGDHGVELISSLPLRSEWYSPIDEITSVRVDARSALIARDDGGTAYFRFFRWNHDAIVVALLDCGLQVEHVDTAT